MIRNLLWIVTGALAVVSAVAAIHMYATMPAQQADIILGSAIAAAVVVGVVILAGYMVHEAVEDRRYRAVLDDVEEHLAPLLTGSTGAEKRMRRYFHDHGQILLNRASERTRRIAAAMDARRPPRRSWLPSWLTQPAPTMSPAAVGQPPADEVVEVHHDDPRGPDPLTAELDELPADLHAGLADAPSPIGDKLAAKWGQVPERAPEGGGDQDALALDYGRDATNWTLMKADLFAMLPPDEAGQGAGAA